MNGGEVTIICLFTLGIVVECSLHGHYEKIRKHNWWHHTLKTIGVFGLLYWAGLFRDAFKGLFG